MTTKGIYIISNPLDNRVYIGKFSRTPYELRKRLHINTLKRGKHHSLKLQNFYNKYGIENLEFKIIFECNSITDEELNNLERDTITEYNSFKTGFNMSLGGEGPVGVIRSKEQRIKISETLKEVYKNRDSEYREAAKAGNVNRKKVIHGEQIYDSAREAAEKNSINYNTMIRKLRAGNSDYRYETQENLEINKPSVIEIEGNIFSSITEAAKIIGYSRATIRSRLGDERFPAWNRIERSNTYLNSGRKLVRND